jgi:hypothetical protein
MEDAEFQELKKFHLSKPESMIKSARKGGPGRLNDLYTEVRDLNWRRECDKKKQKLTS